MMDWQQKAEALAALTEFNIKFRERQWRIGAAEPWYVSQRIDVKETGGSVLTGTYGNGSTPQEAVEDHWQRLVDGLKPTEYLVVRAGDSERRAVRWNGFMWVDVIEAQAA
jgi:hypothetical protein